MLTRDNHVGYAVANLQRKPILMDELKRILLIPDLIVQSMTTSEYKRMINNAVIFFNTFNTGAATNLVLLLTDVQLHSRIKSVMKLIGVWEEDCDVEFYNVLLKEIDI